MVHLPSRHNCINTNTLDMFATLVLVVWQMRNIDRSRQWSCTNQLGQVLAQGKVRFLRALRSTLEHTEMVALARPGLATRTVITLVLLRHRSSMSMSGKRQVTVTSHHRRNLAPWGTAGNIWLSIIVLAPAAA